MYLDNPPKTSVGCRMSTTLRELLEDEARNAGKTLSAHIETFLIRRDNVDVNVDDLKKRLFHLEAENAELRQKKRTMRAKSTPHPPTDLHSNRLYAV